MVTRCLLLVLVDQRASTHIHWMLLMFLSVLRISHQVVRAEHLRVLIATHVLNLGRTVLKHSLGNLLFKLVTRHSVAPLILDIAFILFLLFY